MKVRGMDVDFKISRVKDAEKMEAALQKMEKREKQIQKEKGNLSLVLTHMIEMFRDFFKETTGIDILDGCEDLDEAREEYYSFLNQIAEQKKEFLGAYDPNRIK